MGAEQKTGTGSVSLVGAGTGAADLITLRGLDRIRRADVIVHDDLVDEALLAEAPDGVELVYVGKRGWRQGPERPDTGELLVRKAREGGGKRVVRLKSGDPMVFGRGGEEIAVLARTGVPFEIVPGVTAALASAAAAGIPLTLRDVSAAVTFVTGNLRDESGTPRIPADDLAAFARAGGTLCVYMGLRALPELSAALRDAGVPGTTPAAVVSAAFTPDERVLESTLADVPTAAESEAIASPALLVIGEVAAHRSAPAAHDDQIEQSATKTAPSRGSR